MAIASCKEGRVLKRLDETKGIVPRSLCASPDGRTLYLVDAGKVLAVDVESGRKSPVGDGNGVTIDPTGTFLILQVNQKDGVKLFKKTLADGVLTPIAVQAELRLSPSPIGGNAIGPDGRLVVTVSRLGSWFSSPALLDPVTGFLELVPVQFDGDIFPTTFTKSGTLLGRGSGLKCELWRLRPRAAPGQASPPKKG